MHAISVRGLRMNYGHVRAVDGINFDVGTGEIFALLGPNGAGKTTTIEILEGYRKRTGGEVTILGVDPERGGRRYRERIGIMLQAGGIDADMTVLDTVRLYAGFYRRPRPIDATIAMVGLDEHRKARIRTLSGGLQRRLDLCLALIGDPEIIFLDEPTTGLDPVSRVAVWEMLNHLKNARNLTMLLTTHYMDEADRLCDRIAIVDHGKLVALDTPMALKASVPGTNVVEAQFAEESAEWPARLKQLSGVTSVESQSAGMYRLLTSNGSLTTTQLVELATQTGDSIKSLSVQNTTLDDVFVHYTGRQLRDEQVKAHGFVMPPRPGMQP